MYICPICKAEFEDGANFCPICGSKVEMPQVTNEVVTEVPPEAVVPVQAQLPVYSQPIYQQPFVNQQPKSSTRAMAIIGMICSISALVFAAIGFFYTFIFAIIPDSSDSNLVAISFGIYFSLFSLPGFIVGLILSGKSRKEWPCGMNRAGKVMGIIAAVLTGLMLLCSFAGLSKLDYDTYDDYNDYGYYDEYKYGEQDSYKF